MFYLSLLAVCWPDLCPQHILAYSSSAAHVGKPAGSSRAAHVGKPARGAAGRLGLLGSSFAYSSSAAHVGKPAGRRVLPMLVSRRGVLHRRTGFALLYLQYCVVPE